VTSTTCYIDLDYCGEYNSEGDKCTICIDDYHLGTEGCIRNIDYCINYDTSGLVCEECQTKYDLETSFNDCVFQVRHCILRNSDNRQLCGECALTYTLSEN
jgi:hypothetical protein